MKFIHAADIHLDSPLTGLSAYPEAPAQRLRMATRDALARLISRAIEEQVDFLVIAGDLYDGNWRDFHTGLFFVRQMGRLRQAAIPVYLLYGNHDAENEMTRSLQLPDNVYVFPSRSAHTFRIENLCVALHGQSFKQAATTHDLVPGYPVPVDGWFNIGVLHTALEGNAQHASYAPSTLAALRAKGYQYWALGHVHKQTIFPGLPAVAWPGNLQGRHIRETGPHGALLVTVDGDGEIAQIEPFDADVLRWHVRDIDISAFDDMPSVVRHIGEDFQALLAQEEAGMPVAVRVLLTGRSAAHTALLLDEQQLRQEVIAQAVALDADRIWVEKICIHSQAPAGNAIKNDSETLETLDAIAALQALAQTAVQDEDFVRLLQDDWNAALQKMPHDIWTLVPELAALRQAPEAQIAEQLAQAMAVLTARLEKIS